MKSKQPNIIYIFADQMRAQAAGYAGDPNVRTPHLDSLAGESFRFNRAVSTCPVCTPSRACLLTGQYPLTHGLFMNDLCLGEREHTLGVELGRAGYTTGWIGKWHLDGHGRKSYIPPERRHGFSYWKVLECTHDYNNSLYYEDDDTVPKMWEGYDAYAQTEDACRFIRAQAAAGQKEGPFALFLSFGGPHDPYDTAPADLKELYPPEDIILRENVAPHRQALARKQLQGYYAHVTAIDRCAGKLLSVVGEMGIEENTIFVFTSDHGDMLESHWCGCDDIRGVRKQVPYDESVLVPLLIRFPVNSGAKGCDIDFPVASPDIMPTLLGLSGLDIPETVEGEDLSPFLDGEKSPDRETVLIANYHPFADWRTQRGGRPYRGVRTKRYTYVRDKNGPWMLFDNREDPYQLENLVNTSSAASVQKELEGELRRILKKHRDDFAAPAELRRRWNYEVDDREEIPY